MTTLDEHIDELDKMVVGGTSAPTIRSQIAFISREVAALEAELVRVNVDHANLKEAYLNLQAAQAEKEADPFTNFKGHRFKIGTNGESDGLVYCPNCPTPLSSGQPHLHLTCSKCNFISPKNGYFLPDLIKEAQEYVRAKKA